MCWIRGWDTVCCERVRRFMVWMLSVLRRFNESCIMSRSCINGVQVFINDVLVLYQSCPGLVCIYWMKNAGSEMLRCLSTVDELCIVRCRNIMKVDQLISSILIFKLLLRVALSFVLLLYLTVNWYVSFHVSWSLLLLRIMILSVIPLFCMFIMGVFNFER